MKRRDFSLLSIMGMSSVALSSSIQASTQNTGDKSVLWIWLGGGISHIETFNPIPNAPVEYRSVRGHINTPIGEIGADFKNLAKLTDDITIVRSFKHRDSNHSTATKWVMTGEPHFNSPSQKWPSVGSVMLNQFGTNSKETGIPLYVKTSKVEGDDAAFLGGKYMGYDADPQGVDNLYLGDGISKERFYLRLKALDAINSQLPEYGHFKDWNDLREQAVQVITGSAAKAFRLDEESKDKQTKFKTNTKFGKDSLLSVRLLQNGVRFVTLSNNGWDMHSNISQGFQNKAQELDYMLSAIISELKERGLYESTLIVMSSEFGRTSKVNGNAGRDHQSSVNTLLFAGGGYEHGRIIGKTDKTASKVEEDEFNPKDLVKTTLSHLDIEGRLRIVGTDRRPHELIEENGKNILEKT